MASLRYFPTEDVMLYGSYSRGFKSGGFNQRRTMEENREEENNTQFDPEYSTNLEAGAKTSWFGRMLTLNGTVFYTWYSDFQSQSFDGSGWLVSQASNALYRMTIEPSKSFQQMAGAAPMSTSGGSGKGTGSPSRSWGYAITCRVPGASSRTLSPRSS